MSTTTVGTFTKGTVAAAGFDVTYYEAGSGVPLIMLPGAGGPRIGPAHDALAEQFRVVVIELPGWGMQPNDVADFDGLADQVAEVIAAIGIDTYHLSGNSLGGACALHLASRYPENSGSTLSTRPSCHPRSSCPHSERTPSAACP
jgi:4,5:9,10-diseco-3-hydroxy-5,9,17-trioxoandrosta-1(10),2-diene-4-oate hydrolase